MGPIIIPITMKITFLMTILCLFCLTGCNSVQIKQNEDVYIADIDNAQKEEFVLQSSIYQKVNPIILESGEGSLIGTIDKIQVFDNFILVLDRRMSRSLFVFDNQGNFIRRIGNTGKGPGEYMRPGDFTIDDKGFAYILDSDRQSILKYEINTGNHINTIIIAGDRNVSSHHILYESNKIFSDAYFRNITEDNYLLRIIDPTSGKQQGSLLTESDYNKGYHHTNNIEQYAFYNSPDGAIFMQQFMDTIFHIGSGGVMPYLSIKSKNILSKDDLKDLDPSDPSLFHSKLWDKNKIFNIREYIERDDIIFLKYSEGRYSKSLSYNKKNRVTTIYQGIKPDMLFSDDLKSYVIPQFGYSDNKGAYYYINPEWISNYQQYAKDGMLAESIDRDKIDALKNLKEDANPVILFFEFK